MQNEASRRARSFRSVTAFLLAMAVSAWFAWDVLAAAGTTVSQMDRSFRPEQLAITRGDTVHVLNDDGELLHHAYVASDTFNFDSGEQEPGSITDIHFTKTGTFAVRCRIHPKMALVVTVK